MPFIHNIKINISFKPIINYDFKKIFLIIMALLSLLVNVSTFGEYGKLTKDENISIRLEDLPEEFTSEAYGTIVEFIQKTKNLEYECIMYFDYVTGQILKFETGLKDEVKIEFSDGEFEGLHIASIHNHPPGVYSPPSDKNFGILMRDFEDYELVVGQNGLWILKAKGIDFQLNFELKFSALQILDSCQEYSKNKSPYPKSDEICDIMYGVTLSNYINDKNINDIQLTKVEYEL